MLGSAEVTMGRKEVLRLIDEMEDEYDQPFRFNPEAVHPQRATRSTSAVEPGPMGAMGSMFMARGEDTRAKPSEKNTLRGGAMYKFLV